jgi:hypothetical protein
MSQELSLDELWNSAVPKVRVFQPDRISGLPEPARRYLEHAIASGTPLATAVRLRMHGEIKLGQWLPFTAEEVIHWSRGMIWKATVRRNGIPIRGSDRLVDGKAAMRWKLFGLIPVMTASGPDITRSAAGRMMAESVWLPSALLRQESSWTGQEVRLTVAGESANLTLAVDGVGRLHSLHLSRWGNPEGKEFRYVDFGGVVEEEATFRGYTVPARIRIGYYPGTPRFDTEGEFFRGFIDSAEYR